MSQFTLSGTDSAVQSLNIYMESLSQEWMVQRSSCSTSSGTWTCCNKQFTGLTCVHETINLPVNSNVKMWSKYRLWTFVYKISESCNKCCVIACLLFFDVRKGRENLGVICIISLTFWCGIWWQSGKYLKLDHFWYGFHLHKKYKGKTKKTIEELKESVLRNQFLKTVELCHRSSYTPERMLWSIRSLLHETSGDYSTKLDMLSPLCLCHKPCCHVLYNLKDGAVPNLATLIQTAVAVIQHY